MEELTFDFHTVSPLICNKVTFYKPMLSFLSAERLLKYAKIAPDTAFPKAPHPGSASKKRCRRRKFRSPRARNIPRGRSVQAICPADTHYGIRRDLA
jgi:hypothetical protein